MPRDVDPRPACAGGRYGQPRGGDGMRGTNIPLLLAIISGLLGTSVNSAAAQSAWQSLTPQAGATTAVAQWGDGTAIIARCDAGILTAYIGGRTLMAEPSAFVMMERRGDDPTGEYWRVSANGLVAFARSPAAFIRQVRKGGILDIVIKSRATPDREATISLPTDAAPLDAVLSACGVSTEPPAPVSGSIEWRDTEVDENNSYYPPKALDEGVRGIASLTCRARADGSLTDCLVIDESPGGYLFGQYAAAMVEREMAVRLTAGSTGSLEGRWLTTTAPFLLDGNRRPRIGAPRPGDAPPPPLPFVARIRAEALPLLEPDTPVP